MYFSLGIYSQLPAGTSNLVLERLLDETLTPLLQSLYRNPDEKIVFCLSGFEMEWIESNHPEINVLINSLSRRGQIDFLSTSFNGVCLELLPPNERASEIERTSTFIRRRYSKRPSGFWAFQQMWNSGYIATIDLCSLSYAAISVTPNGAPLSRQKKNPFIMSQFGKSSLIFPTNDEVSKLIQDLYLNKKSTEDALTDISRLRIDRNCIMDYVMINMDQLIYDGINGFQVISAILDRYHQKNFDSRLPDSKYLISNEVIYNGYLPSGIYGYDLRTACNSPNELILSNNSYRGYYQLLDKIRNLVKVSLSERTVKKEINNVLTRCLSAFPFVFDCDGCTSRYTVEKGFFEAVNIMKAKGVAFPLEIDIDDDTYDELIFHEEDILVIFDSKGGSISTLMSQKCLPNFKRYSSIPIFSDSLNTLTSKEFRLDGKRYSMESQDKVNSIVRFRLERFCKEGIDISLTKEFRIRKNSFSISINIHNNSDSPSSFRYSLHFPCLAECELNSGKTSQVCFNVKGNVSDYLVTCNASGFPFLVDGTKIEGIIRTPIADEQKYLYTDYRYHWDLQMKPDSDFVTVLDFTMRKIGVSHDFTE